MKVNLGCWPLLLCGAGLNPRPAKPRGAIVTTLSDMATSDLPGSQAGHHLDNRQCSARELRAQVNQRWPALERHSLRREPRSVERDARVARRPVLTRGRSLPCSGANSPSTTRPRSRMLLTSRSHPRCFAWVVPSTPSPSRPTADTALPRAVPHPSLHPDCALSVLAPRQLYHLHHLGRPRLHFAPRPAVPGREAMEGMGGGRRGGGCPWDWGGRRQCGRAQGQGQRARAGSRAARVRGSASRHWGGSSSG